MADEATPGGQPPAAAAPAAPAPAAPAAPAPDDQRVPYDRFREANERAKAAEQQLGELQKWKEEQEAKGLSELERIRRQQQQAEQRAAEAETRLVQVERSGYIRNAAAAARFMDPEDAVAFLNGKLADFDTPQKAQKAVEDLAKSKPHLVSPASGWDGGARGPGGPQPDAQSAEFMEQLRSAQASAGWQAVPLD